MKLNERVLELMNTFLRIGSVIVVLVIEMVLIISPVVFLQRSAISVYSICSCSAYRSSMLW